MEEVLRPRLTKGEAIPFDQFMELALYHEEHGYYSDPSRTRVGRAGDFATNMSVGETFGRLLASRLHELWRAHGSPGTLHLFELGPEDGSLALDILKWARELSSEFHAALRYLACEHSARKRVALEARLATSGEEFLVVANTPHERQGDLGIVLANEVLDALPVDLIRFQDGRWHQRQVTLQGDALGWHDLPIDDPEIPAPLPSLAPGYQTEVCRRLPSFFADLTPLFDRGLFLFIDYGFTSEDYYHPDRTAGTLRTYAGHQASDDPLDAPGLRDITAHVDFTAVASAARDAQLRVLGFARQESYLTSVATPLLRSLSEGSVPLSFIRQFRTLTHPGFFGSKFHVLELSKGELAPGFVFPCPTHDLGTA